MREYEDGQPVPPGYRVVQRSRLVVAAVGGAILLLTYLPALYGAALASAAKVDGVEALYAPAAGPFIAIGTLHAEGAGIFWLSVLGLAQTAGLVTAVVGLAMPDEKFLYRYDARSAPPPRRSAQGALARPFALAGPGGAIFGVDGSF